MAAFVNIDTAGSAGSATTIATPGITHTTGNLIVGCVGWDSTNTTVSGIADTAGNTYTLGTRRIGGTSSDMYVTPFWCLNATGDASNVITATLGAAATFRRIVAVQYSGVNAKQGEDHNSVVTTGVVGYATPALTLSRAGVVVGLMGPYNNRTLTPGPSFTERQDSSDVQFGVIDRVVTDGGNYTASCDLSSASTGVLIALAFADTNGVGWTEGSGTVLAADEIDGAKFQRPKLTWGADGTATDADTVAPVPATLAAVTSGGPSVYRLGQASGTNSASVKASAATVYGIVASNANSSPAFLKLYDKASAPTVGTDVPKITIPVPRHARIALPQGMAFGTGLAIAVTTGVADTDTGGVTAGDVTATVFYQ